MQAGAEAPAFSMYDFPDFRIDTHGSLKRMQRAHAKGRMQKAFKTELKNPDSDVAPDP